jgi:hypothetical protein
MSIHRFAGSRKRTFARYVDTREKARLVNGAEECVPTRYLCSIGNYIYDEKRGEPHRGIMPGTKFEDLPED